MSCVVSASNYSGLNQVRASIYWGDHAGRTRETSVGDSRTRTYTSYVSLALLKMSSFELRTQKSNMFVASKPQLDGSNRKGFEYHSMRTWGSGNIYPTPRQRRQTKKAPLVFPISSNSAVHTSSSPRYGGSTCTTAHTAIIRGWSPTKSANPRRWGHGPSPP